MKLSVIKNTEDMAGIVSSVLQYTNNQSKVSEVDLSSNRTFHIDIEKLFYTIWSPTKQGLIHQTPWFYERPL
jgi:hypothetical protein